MRRAVYSIRDCEGWVRYIGSSGCPEGRFASHLNSSTPLGDLMRSERASGRDMHLRIEEWLPTKAEGFSVERLYIEGYARLSGDKLMNKARPSGRVEIKRTVDPQTVCIREHCGKRRLYDGLCQGHWTEIYLEQRKLPKKLQSEFITRCVNAGLMLQPEEEEPDEVTAKSIRIEMTKEHRKRSLTNN